MILDIIQIIIAIGLILVILFQKQSSGLGGAFGGGGGEFFHTKRGAEKVLFYSTIALSILFLTLAIIDIAGL